MTYSALSLRLAAVRERIASACSRAGRHPEDVTIVAVTKTHPPAAVDAAIAAGIQDIGENRVPDLETKVVAIGRGSARWHMIGHVQRNKARKALELSDLIHSVDSVRLARKLSGYAVEAGRIGQVLVQVNIAGEATKGGLEGSGTLDEIGEICSLPGLRVLGLMSMAPLTDDDRLVRSIFSKTRRLRDDAAGTFTTFEPTHLSMGMSSDFEIAIEEGSTLVRLGTVLLGERGV